MQFKPWPVSIAGWVLSLAAIAFCVQVFLFLGTVGSIPINRTRALVICHAPAAYAPTRVREAASYLLQSSRTEDEQRVATEAIEWLRSKRDKPQPVR